jgi:mono/diheme cytochrome c family protein
MQLPRIFTQRPLGLAALVLGFIVGNLMAQEPTAEGIEFFEKRIRPLLVEHCFECHGPEGKAKGNLRLDSQQGWLKGGESGPAFVAGKPDESLAISAVRYWDKSLQMPPEHPLEQQQINDLIQWVTMGAPDPRTNLPAEDPAAAVAQQTPPSAKSDHWSFQAITNPPLPEVTDPTFAVNEIDRFILASMERAGVHPAPLADKAVLLRRVTYDLTGLPPTPQELEDFLKDDSPEAYRRVVDRLLASPRYGEHWGRHWMDVVRYADTCGNASDFPVPQLYQYRNYIIDSFNRDVPFPQMIRQQIAGDLLPETDATKRRENVIATGYLASVRHFAGGDGEPHLTIEDAIDNMGRAFLGLTLSCARCHDHKFDPVSTTDYYGLYGIFQSTVFPHPGSEGSNRPKHLVPLLFDDALAQATADWQKKMAELEERAVKADQEKAEAQKLPDGPDKTMRLDAAGVAAQEARKEKNRLQFHPPFDQAYAVSEGTAADARVQVRGDPKRLGDTVPRRFLSLLGGASLKDPARSGRLELAEWLNDPANPLTARVIVNRVWLYHFGRGLVGTPNDFGTRGAKPSHPELLDYLAGRFQREGGSLKSLHRLILLSRTWQASADTYPIDKGSWKAGFYAENMAKDPGNTLWWRADRKRLDAESVRDTLFYVSGSLDETPGEAHPFPPVETWNYTQHNQFFAVYDTPRRMVYQMQQRLRRHPFLELFDGADPNSSTASRTNAVTPLQTLFMLNDPLVHEKAAAFAKRMKELAPETTARVELAFQTLFARKPREEEVLMAATYLTDLQQTRQLSEDEAWASLTRALFSTNEFFYLD